MTDSSRGFLFTQPPAPEDTRTVRDLPPAIAGTLEQALEESTEADSQSADSAPSPTHNSSRVPAPADD
ncbi:hypothetical protein ACLI4R_15365 [Natrialbaceae archaeon A-chndr2]